MLITCLNVILQMLVTQAQKFVSKDNVFLPV